MLRIGHVVVVLALLAGSVTAQEQAATEAASEVVLLGGDEVDVLVTRVALYPDPLLALVLQGSTLPIQAVQAARFVTKRAEDPSLQPDPTWDTSIVGLLNYPTVLAMMDDDLDWTERLGTAVVQQLEDVQASIQQIRSELQAAGALASNDKQSVIVSEETIKIEPAEPDVIYVPSYQPAAAPAAAEAAPAEAAAGPAPTPSAAPAPAQPTYAAPVTAPAAYAAAPVTYSQPYPSFWSNTAAFAGGAVVGGVLGYAIGEDNDDIELDLDEDIDWDDFDPDDYNGSSRRGGINIEDSNVVVAGGNRTKIERQTQLAQSQLSANRQRASSITPQQRAQAQAKVAQRPAGSVAAANRPATRNAQSVQRPAAATKAAASRGQQPQQRVGERPAAGKGGAFQGVQPQKQVRKEAERGARSRAATQRAAPAQRQLATPQQSPPRAVASRPPAATAKRAGAAPTRSSDVQRVADRGARSRGNRPGR